MRNANRETLNAKRTISIVIRNLQLIFTLYNLIVNF